MSTLKKVFLTLGLGLGLSAANAAPTTASCEDMKSACDAGNTAACIQAVQICTICELDPTACDFDDDSTFTIPPYG